MRFDLPYIEEFLIGVFLEFYMKWYVEWCITKQSKEILYFSVTIFMFILSDYALLDGLFYSSAFLMRGNR